VSDYTEYDFYGYLSVRLDSRHRGYRRYFDNEYLRIAGRGAATPGAPQIRVEIPRRLPEAQPGDLVRTVRFKKLFTFRYLVRGLGGDVVTIYFQRHWLDSVYMNAIGVFLQAQVLEPIMYMKFLDVGIVFLHAAGVVRDGEGILMPAYGGTGKTTLSMALMADGYQLLGDDLLIVDVAAEKVYPYPRPLHIFTYNVKNLRGARIPFKYRAAVYLKNVIRWPLERILRTEFLISTRIHADEIFSGDLFGEPGRVAAIGFLRKEGEVVELVTITPENVERIADEIARSADLNDSLRDLLGADNPLWASVHERELEVLAELLRRRGLIAYVNTRRLDLDHLEGFRERILGRDA